MQLNFRNMAGMVLVFIVTTFLVYNILALTDRIALADIDSSLMHAQLYLKSAYNESYLYDDSYLRCLPPCDPRYKKIDGAIDLIWIGDEVKEHSIIDYQIKNADEFLKNQTTFLENEPLFDDQGVFIGDQHCILAAMYNDTKILNEVEASAHNYGWMNRSVLDEENLYKKIAYESWCVIFLAEKGSNISKAVAIAEEDLNETFEIIQAPQVSVTSKIYAALHSLIVFKNLHELGYPMEPYKNRLATLQEFLYSSVEDSSVISDTNIQSLVLDTLSDYNYDAVKTSKIALRILNRQQDDGSWGMYTDSNNDYGRAFTTLHVILALNKYRIVYLGG